MLRLLLFFCQFAKEAAEDWDPVRALKRAEAAQLQHLRDKVAEEQEVLHRTRSAEVEKAAQKMLH